MEADQVTRPSAGFSVTVTLKIANVPGKFQEVVSYLADNVASLSDVNLLYSDFNYLIREITINCRSEQHSLDVIAALEKMPDISLLGWVDDTFEIHEGGKLDIHSRISLKTTDELSRAYTPGVARVCNAIAEDESKAYRYTMKGSTIAVVTDGSAVLGLGNIGPKAALPVMEGKAVLFKNFAQINAVPICLDTQDTEEIITAVKYLAPNFAGINLEDISAPRCFEIEERLRKEIDIPVFHDDQHGTAAVVLAGVINALKIVDKKLENMKVVLNGFGAGGAACAKMLLSAGVTNILPCDRAGVVYRGRKERMNPVKEELIKSMNPDNVQGTVEDAMKGADIFIGVSKPGAITPEMVKSMAKDPIVFALANPVPEIMPAEIEGIARVVATGRSDYANQVNNVLCFPGIFRGAIDSRASDITEGMRLAAAYAIAEAIDESELHERSIIPSVFRNDVASLVAARVREAAKKDGVSRI